MGSVPPTPCIDSYLSGRFITQAVCAGLSCFSHVLLLATPWTITRQTPVHGILQARILEQVAISFSRDLPKPGIEPTSHVSCTGRQVLYHQRHLGSPSHMLLLLSHFSHVRLCDPIYGSPPGFPVPGILLRFLKPVGLPLVELSKQDIKRILSPDTLAFYLSD